MCHVNMSDVLGIYILYEDFTYAVFKIPNQTVEIEFSKAFHYFVRELTIQISQVTTELKFVKHCPLMDK